MTQGDGGIVTKKMMLMLIATSLILIITGCTSSSDNEATNTIEYYEEMMDTYEDLGTINDEGLTIIEGFFAIITRIDNDEDEDDIEGDINDNLDSLESVKESNQDFREMVLNNANQGSWDNDDSSNMILILDNIEIAMDDLDQAHINLIQYNESRNKDESQILEVMMDIGVIQDLLLNNRERIEDNIEVFYYRIQNHG